MKLDCFFYKVQTEVVFTEADVDVAIRCSERHYDAKCRAASKQGGFLYGMKNQVRPLPGVNPGDPEEKVESATHGFSWDQLDTLAKIMEGAVDPEERAFGDAVRRIFAETRKESERINAHLDSSGRPKTAQL